MDPDATTNRKLPDMPKGTVSARRAINMEFLYDTTLVTAAVFVFALILSATT
jgi:hypothetical protein